MNRRDFVATAGIASIAPIAASSELTGLTEGASAGKADQQFFELRKYTSRVGPHKGKLAKFLESTAIPAWNRHGIANVGVFNVMYGPNAPTTYVLLAHSTLASVGMLRDKLAGDKKYQTDGADFLSASLADPGYTRIESSLFKAFSEMPEVAVPAGAEENAPRIFELRIYESHSDAAAIRKVEMFNNGEIPIFLKTGLTPVFFGEAMVGEKLPNLTYMLTFKNMADRDESWSKFIAHPDWKKMSADPYYKDTVSNITSIILRPLPFSQL